MHVDNLGLTRTMPVAPTPPLRHHPQYISLLTRRLLACFLSPPTSRTSSDQLLFRFRGHLNHTRILSSLTPIIPLISALALLPLILMYHIPTLILTIRTPHILQVKRRQLMPFHALYIIESLATRKTAVDLIKQLAAFRADGITWPVRAPHDASHDENPNLVRSAYDLVLLTKIFFGPSPFTTCYAF